MLLPDHVPGGLLRYPGFEALEVEVWDVLSREPMQDKGLAGFLYDHLEPGPEDRHVPVVLSEGQGRDLIAGLLDQAQALFGGLNSQQLLGGRENKQGRVLFRSSGCEEIFREWKLHI